jgi:hypothetical protein
VESYKSSRRATVLQELVGNLDSDAAAAAQRLEQQTAELQRLEAAVADKAAVLQKLNEQVEMKQVRSAAVARLLRLPGLQHLDTLYTRHSL